MGYPGIGPHDRSQYEPGRQAGVETAFAAAPVVDDMVNGSREIAKKSIKSTTYGGESGIRTHETVTRPHAFQACAFSHSAISPQ